MEHFSIGIASFVAAIIFPLIYFFGLQFRRIGAWSKREDGPKERVSFFLVVATVIGFGLGSFAQPLVDKASECSAANKPVLSCVMLPK
ncbi:MAG: hypothetical protein ABW098_17545 [Candidatus Thiodiazotropha sp.]